MGGFEVPAYQRPYRWTPAQVRRLFEDLINALNRLRNDREGIAFIGAMITINTVSKSHSELPPNARQIIDGQQRLTTVLMTAAALHAQLGEANLILQASEELGEAEPETLSWLSEQIAQARGDLLGCLFSQRVAGDPGFRELPKVIREMTDTWGKKADTAKYKSPIANLLFRYVRAELDDTSFELEPPDVLEVPEAFGASIEAHSLLYRRFRQIRQMLKGIASASEAELDATVTLPELLHADSVALEGLFYGVDQDTYSGLRRVAADERGASVIRLLLFARYLLDHVALTQILARDEAYAFDLFDSLNTTGEPLTAFETFVRLVVEAEGGVAAYQNSPSYGHIAITGKLLEEREASVQRETLNLVTSFALADHGAKVASNLNDQRYDLNQQYNAKGISLKQRRGITRQLADSALTYFSLWRDDRLRLSPGEDAPRSLSPETAIGLKFADAINHSILVAPMSRYFAQFRAKPTEANQATLERALRAMIAFSALWRAAHGGTDGIDAVYRSLMQHGVDGVCPPLARTPADKNDENPLPSVDQLVQAFRTLAAKQGTLSFSSEQSWIDLAAKRGIYDEQEKLARFLLLLSGHHAASKGASGLLRDGAQADDTNFLRPERWTDQRLITIEHVAPQKRPGGEDDDWPDDVYAAPGDQLHRIGNLTLIPISENIEISNRTWKAKRYLYRALTADGADPAKTVLDEAVEAGVSVKPELRERIIERRRKLPALQAIAKYEGTWDADFIDKRSRDLLARAWKILDDWLA